MDRSTVILEAEIGKMWLQVKECWWPPEAGKGKEWFLLEPQYPTSGLRKCERTNFCCVKPPSMWQLGTAAPGNRYRFLMKNVREFLGHHLVNAAVWACSLLGNRQRFPQRFFFLDSCFQTGSWFYNEKPHALKVLPLLKYEVPSSSRVMLAQSGLSLMMLVGCWVVMGWGDQSDLCKKSKWSWDRKLYFHHLEMSSSTEINVSG